MGCAGSDASNARKPQRKSNDYIPPLDGGISDVGEDDENLFDFMFD